METLDLARWQFAITTIYHRLTLERAGRRILECGDLESASR